MSGRTEHSPAAGSRRQGARPDARDRRAIARDLRAPLLRGARVWVRLALVLACLFVPSFGLKGLVWLLGVGIPLLIVSVFLAYVAQGRLLRARAEGLEAAEEVRGPLGVGYLIRGEQEGRAVRVLRDRVEVAVDSPLVHVLDRPLLRALAAGELPAEHPLAGPRTLQAAVRRLLDRGVTELELDGRKAIARGGEAPAARLVADLVAVAQAPLRIRFAVSPPAASGCPYCRGPLEPITVAPRVRCSACDAVHHAECWREHGGCAVFRCRRAPVEGRERAAVDEGAAGENAVAAAAEGHREAVRIRISERA